MAQTTGLCTAPEDHTGIGPGVGIYRTFSEQHYAADSHAANGRAY